VRLRVIAVGNRMPSWVEAAVSDYRRRLPAAYRFELSELPLARRKQDEGRRLLALLHEREFVIALDERGSQPDTLELARWLEARRQAGLDLVFLIGGPDGLASEVLARAQYRWSLSRLTLPHALVRVILAEQLYRASTVLAGHPYHRS
jgi:23S rRNA (pseudouridine1915-N3)-methyltransferase